MEIMKDNSIEYDCQYFRNRKPKKVRELERDILAYQEANLGLIKVNNKLVQDNKELKRRLKVYEEKEALEKQKERESEQLNYVLGFIVFAPIVYVLIKAVIISIA